MRREKERETDKEDKLSRHVIVKANTMHVHSAHTYIVLHVHAMGNVSTAHTTKYSYTKIMSTNGGTSIALLYSTLHCTQGLNQQDMSMHSVT